MAYIGTFIKINKRYLIIFLLAVLNLFFIYFFFDFPKINADTPGYIEAIVHFREKSDVIDNINRLLTTPLMLISMVVLSNLFNGDLYSGMLLINLVLYFLTIYVYYKLSFDLFKDLKAAVFSTLLVLFNFCFYSFGPTYYADIGGWFFYILGTFFAFKYVQTKGNLYYYLSVASAVVGIFFKETGALSILTLVLLILFSSNYSRQLKFKKILLAVVLFSIIPLLYHLWFYGHFHYSYFDWRNYVHSITYADYQYQTTINYFVLLIKVLIYLFSFGWMLFLLGLRQIKKDKNWELGKTFLILIPSSLLFLAYPALTARLSFVILPWLSLIAGYYLAKIKNKFLVIVFLLLYMIFNYLVMFKLEIHQFYLFS